MRPPLDGKPDVAAWLASGEAFGCSGPVRRIDTHAASVFLSGQRAWKLKRPVRFDYLDFSTADRRHEALEAELRLNRRTAPELYRSVHAITRDAAGQLAIDGAGEPIDWVLEMRRFPDDALWDSLAEHGKLDEPSLWKVADLIAAFHRDAPVSLIDDAAARFRGIVAGNAASMAKFPDILDPNTARSLSDRLAELVEKHRDILDARGREGRVRHVHGDLHLANIAMLDGVPTPFDCLEFDTALATIDVLYDIAFLWMDLWKFGLRREANIVFNRYLDRSGQDEAGGALTQLFMAVRASIRAHVWAAKAARTQDRGNEGAVANQYLRLAHDIIADGTPRLIAIGGLSGTGKSTLARAIGGDFGTPPGARIFRSDVLRKRMAGVALETRLPASAYTPIVSRSVHAEMAQLARETLISGRSVIADATFRLASERDAMADVAMRAAVHFDGLWLEAPDSARIARVEARHPEASDANAPVAMAQSAAQMARPTGWTRVDTSGQFEALLAKVSRLLDASL